MTRGIGEECRLDAVCKDSQFSNEEIFPHLDFSLTEDPDSKNLENNYNNLRYVAQNVENQDNKSK